MNIESVHAQRQGCIVFLFPFQLYSRNFNLTWFSIVCQYRKGFV